MRPIADRDTSTWLRTLWNRACNSNAWASEGHRSLASRTICALSCR